MSLRIRRRGAGEPDLARLAHTLWTEDPPEARRAEIAAATDPGLGGRRGFVAERAGAALGFAEPGLRSCAGGRGTRPAAFRGGVRAPGQARRQRRGRARLAHVEAPARAGGLRETGTDALIANRAARSARRAWGFAEAEPVLRSRKAL